MTIRSVAIIGAGQGGFQVAVSLRQGGFAGEIVLVGDEAGGVPYQRPPLSKAYLLGRIGFDALRFRPEKFFVDQKIRLVHARATGIDRTNRRVEFQDGEAVEYDHLVIAVGAHNRSLPVPGADLDGVFGLRTAADADALRARLDEARDVVVAGAGFIGLEFAAVASARGANVTVLDIASRPMARGVSAEMSAIFARVHRDWGVNLLFGEGLAWIEGADRRVRTVQTTAQRRLSADIVVFGIGVLPNIQLAAEAGLDVENGVKTDAYLLTSDPAISAIGDCASFPSPYTGEHIRLESVQNATDQARTVADRLLGKGAPYTAVPWFWTDQGGLKLQMAGVVAGYDRSIVIGDPDQNSASVLCFRRGQLVGAESLNRAGDHMAARRLLARAGALSPDEAAKPGFDLKAWEAASR